MTNGNDKRGFTLSYQALGGIVALISVLGVGYGGVQKIATKGDIERAQSAVNTKVTEVRKEVDEQDARIRDLERQWDRFFGMSGPSSPTPSDFDLEPLSGPTNLLLVSQSGRANRQEKFRPRRPVVLSYGFISRFDLHPSRGGTYGVLGEDGHMYSLDEVLAVLIRNVVYSRAAQR